LRESDVDRTVTPPQDAAGVQETAQRFRLLFPATELALIRFFLDHPTIVDRYRHQVEIAPHAVDEGVDDRRQNAELRRQNLPCSTASALDEELLGIPLADEEGEVFAENELVELVAREAAADEVGTGAAKQRSQGPERQVDAGGDVRRAQVVQVEQIRDDQIIKMATVTG